MYIFFIYPTPVFGGGVKDAACGFKRSPKNEFLLS